MRAMSDERPQQHEQVQVAQADQPEQWRDKWGDPISEERKTELQGYLDRWVAETDHGERRGRLKRNQARRTVYG
jgi:hypothetical protein